jgi:proton-coupled amino acid transporter
MSESSSSPHGFSPRLLAADDDLGSSMSRVISTHSGIAEAANLPPPIPPFGTSPAQSFGRGSPFNHPADIVEQLFAAHGSPVPANSVAAYESGLIDLPEEEVARVVKEHLLFGSPRLNGRNSPSIYSAHDSEAASALHSSVHDEESEDATFKNVHQLPGGSIVDGIYKWAANVESQQMERRTRSQSFSFPAARDVDDVASIRAPGGFRRHYVINKAAEQGKAPPNYITRNFFDFLCLYGNFGGEDLNDDDEETGEDEEETTGLRHRRRRDENTPLLPKPSAPPPQGTATPSKAVFLLLKSFVGTGKGVSV